MSDLTVTSYSSSGSGVRSVDFTNGNIIVSNNAGGTLVNMATITNFTNLTTNPTVNTNGFIITNNSATATTITIGALSEANSCNFLFNTGTYAITLTASGVFRNLNFTGFSGSIATNVAQTIYGSLTLSSTMTAPPAGASAWTFGATSSQTITSAGKPLDFPLTFNGVGGTWALQDNLTSGASRTTTLTNGTINLGTRTFTTGLFNGSNANTRSIIWGVGGKFVLNYTATASATIWTTSTITGFTVGGTGDPVVEVTGGGNATFIKTITLGALSESNSISLSLVETTGAHSITITNTSGVRNLVLNGTQTLTSNNVTIYGDYTNIGTGTTLNAGTGTWTFASTSGTKNLSPNGRTHNFEFAFNGVGGTWKFLQGIVFGSTYAIFLNNGTLDFNGQSITGALEFNVDLGTFTLTDTSSSSYTTSIPFDHTSGTLNLGVNLTTTSTLGYIHRAGTLNMGSYTLQTPFFSSTTSTARTINFGTGKIRLNSNTAGAIWNTGTVTNLTVNGSANIECLGGGTSITKSINTGALNPNTTNLFNFSFIDNSSTVTYQFAASDRINNFFADGTQSINAGNIAIRIYGNFVHASSNGTTTFTGGSSVWTFDAGYATYVNGVGTTITTGNNTYDFPWTMNSFITFTSGSTTINQWGNITIVDSLNLAAGRILTLANGVLNANNKTVSAANITVSTGATAFATVNDLSTTTNVQHTTGTLTLGTNTTTGNYTFSAGTLEFNNRNLTVPSFTSSGTGVRTLSFGTGKILLNGNSTSTIWNTATVSNLTVTGTPLVECAGDGTGVTKTLNTGNLAVANSISFSLLETGGTVTYAFTANNVVRNFVVNGSQTLENRAITILGNYNYSNTNGNTAFTSGTNAWTFASTTGTNTITSNGATHPFPWTFNGVGGNWILNDALTLGANGTLTLANGTLDLNGVSTTVDSFVANTGTKTLIFDGATMTVTGANFNVAAPANMTFTAGTGNGTISMTSSSVKQFAGANITYPATLNQAGSGNLEITGNNTFDSLTFTYRSTGNSNVVLEGGSNTTIVNTLSNGLSNTKYVGILGKGGNSAVSNDRNSGVANVIYQSPGNANIVLDYMRAGNVRFIHNGGWANVLSGNLPFQWYLANNSINEGSTLGAVFANNDGNTAPVIYYITTGTSFTIPNNWWNSNNTIHLWGGGGGGGGGFDEAGGTGNISGGGGGGGGGYTRINNYKVPAAGTVVSLSIGAGGPGGAITQNGSNGGQTTFGGSYTANGGIRGTSASTTFGSGGAGGTGSTYSGGGGGRGTFTTNAGNNSGGGGGGGAGGPQGIGGTGGNGSATNGSSALVSGGGGGGYSGGSNGVAGNSTASQGGNNFSGVGGGGTGLWGWAGGGGGGGLGAVEGAPAGPGYDILNSVGAAGGMGGGGGNCGVVNFPVDYIGGGGGGGGCNDAGFDYVGGNGGTGAIIITYYACTNPNFTSSSSMFLMFG